MQTARAKTLHGTPQIVPSPCATPPLCRFQEDKVFLHYAHNRIHRLKINSQFRVYINQRVAVILVSIDLTCVTRLGAEHIAFRNFWGNFVKLTGPRFLRKWATLGRIAHHFLNLGTLVWCPPSDQLAWPPDSQPNIASNSVVSLGPEISGNFCLLSENPTHAA